MDPVFEKRYETYADDQTMGRYIINPSFMEKFMQLDDLFREKAEGKGAEVSFYGNYMLLKLSYDKNLLESPHLLKHAVSMEEINFLYEEIKLIFGVAESLNLSNSK